MTRHRTSQRSMRLFTASATTLAITAMVTACGGGNGTAQGTDDNSGTAQAITLSGTAATGAPMAGARIVVKDSTGSEVQTCAPCTVSSTGEFAIELKVGANAPFVLYATQEGSDEPEVSVVYSTQSTTVNVSPITTLVAARLAPQGDPALLVATGLTSAQISAAITEVQTALRPLLEAVGLSAEANPMTMAFKADSTGLDKALDILGKPSIVRRSDGQTTVEIEVKTGGSDDTSDADSSPAKITLTAGAAPVATGITLAKMQASLPADGVSLKISDLLQRMQNCYALAPADRRANGATWASHITADVCKQIFVNNDPSQYLHNNTVVSQAGATLPADIGGRFSGAFKGIFGSVQGLRHDLPEYRYTIKNGNTTDASRPMEGDVVFTARWTVTDPNAGVFLGQSDVGEYHARPQNGELKMIGNQSKHDLNINAQARRENMPAVADHAYLSTGYNMGISERKWNHDNNNSTARVSIYESVVVTSPSGKTFTLKPIPGNNYEYLGLVGRSGTTTASASVRLNGAYLNAATTGHPSARFTKEFWANPDEWTEAQIAAIPSQGNWKFDITLTQAFADANPSTVPSRTFTQYRRAINRAPTLTELQAVKWPALKDPAMTGFTTAATTQGYVLTGSNSAAEALNLEGWDVPTGAWAPTYAKVYGSSWDEGTDVASTARKVTIRCAGTGPQCEKVSGVNTGQFINAGWAYLQLTGRDSKRLQMSLNYSARQTSSDNN